MTAPIPQGSFSTAVSPRCPIALGTSFAEEAARWGRGPLAHAALAKAHRERLARARQAAEQALAELAEASRAAAASLRRRFEPPIPEPKPAPLVGLPQEVIAFNQTMDAYYKAIDSVPIIKIQMACAEYYGVSLRDIVSKRRPMVVVKPRQVAMYLAKEMTTKSLPEIGRGFGKDHTTCLHAIRKIAAACAADTEMAAAVQTIREKIEAMT